MCLGKWGVVGNEPQTQVTISYPRFSTEVEKRVTLGSVCVTE